MPPANDVPVGTRSEMPLIASQPRLQSDLASRVCLAELGAPDVAAHGGQAALRCMTHDLLVRHAVAAGGGDEAGPQAMRADRLGRFILRTGIAQLLTRRVHGCPRMHLVNCTA